jgi:hypothetical protein
VQASSFLRFRVLLGLAGSEGEARKWWRLGGRCGGDHGCGVIGL